MKIKCIGLGAAGNKAAICLIEQGVVTEQQIMLINSTLRDVPESYRKLAIQYTDGKGSGKERELSKELCLQSIKDGTLSKLDSFIDPDDDMVVLVSSSEGGTGSGAMPILAKYFKNIIGIPVQCFTFTGFEEDGRGLQNTIELFQEMSEEYTVQAISNKKFLESTSNKLKAEKMANEEFAKRISILIGVGIVDSVQNIDDTDLFKVATTPGFMTIGEVELDKLKNIEQFNRMVTEMMDNDVSLEITEKSLKRLAIFINLPEKSHDFVDYNFNIIKDRLGNPYEVFTHIQYNEDMSNSISFIASGMKMPIDEVKSIYEKYKKESESVNKTKDNFFDFAADLRGNQEDNMFNSGINKRRTPSASKMDFLNEMSKGGDKEFSKIKENSSDINNNGITKIKNEDYLKNNF